MDTRRGERLKQYITAVTRSQGGLDSLLSRLDTRDDEGDASSRLFQTRAQAKSGLESLSLGQALTPSQILSTEAIIDSELRPAIDVIDGRFQIDHPLWRDLVTDSTLRTRIEAVMPSIGRLELPGHPSLPYAGTGFVVGDGLVMTNRHVAEVFAAGVGDRRLSFLPDAQAGINFVRERDRPAGTTLRVQKVVMIHPYWDMALLSVSGLPATARPLALSLTDAKDLVAHRIFVVGYPAFDPRNNANEQQSLFAGLYGVKRLQPGELQGAISTASFGKTVTAAAHDCSTLGGNSGSAVIDLSTGGVLALHFGGAYHQMNYAVPSFALANDQRIVDAGVSFGGRAPGGAGEWAQWWNRADEIEAAEPPSAPNRSDVVNSAPTQACGISQTGALAEVSNGQVTLQIPLNITVSLGEIKSIAMASQSVGAQITNATEVMREPLRDEDYSTRRGYVATFLGDGLEVTMPLPRDPAVLALSLDHHATLAYENFSICMHAKRRLALFTASNVTKDPALRHPEKGQSYTRAGLSGLGKNDTERWFIDPRLDARYQLPDAFFTKDRQAFDKGHLVRRDDVAWGSTYEQLRRANGDTYHVTNCSPQVAGFNRSAKGKGNWGDLENHVLTSAATERLCLFAGPVLSEADPIFFGVGDAGVNLQARIPTRFWKIIVARDDDGLMAFGFVLEQDLSQVQWEEFVVPKDFMPTMRRISDIAAMTDLVFTEALHDADQYDTVKGVELALRGAVRR